MNIGFDAKRAYHNTTGLGHYSRTLLNLLSENYPEHQYYLFNPKKSSKYKFDRANIKEVLPSAFPDTMLTAAWRSSWVKKDLQRLNIDIYHGLSHEVPFGIKKTGIKSVVTIHDLIPERYPEQYNPVDVKIYRKKFRYACEQADKIIAISDQTRQDIIDFYKIPGEKIEICWQSCSPLFSIKASEEEKKRISEKYELPAAFFLSVGSIVERKNLLNVCKAFFLLRNDLDVPLLVIGDGGKYKQQVKDFILQNDLEKKIIFLSEKKNSRAYSDFLSTPDLAVIYQSAIAMLYPSFYEGFGLPVLEALWSRLPVITSNVSCLPEIGGPGAYCVDPNSAEDLAEAIKMVYSDKELVADMIAKGIQQREKFAPGKYATSVMDVYKSLMI
ncbi:MAG: glycosyltransferase family 1 protein [Chitinophagaceae bacterium]